MKHSSPEFAALAERGTILRALMGSEVYGTALAGQGDRDEMGICVEPPEYVLGLREFEQYVFRTQPEGARSGPGDLDLVIYSLRKWFRLALQGNPTVLLLLFVPDADVLASTDLGRELRARPELVLSRAAGERFVGYVRAQRAGLLAEKHHTNRPELIETYGFDTKYAMHMVRLGLQGVELLETGRITLPVPEPWRTWLRDLRQGKHTKADALAVAEEMEAKLGALLVTSPLPEQPDCARADKWLIYAHEQAWAAS